MELFLTHHPAMDSPSTKSSNLHFSRCEASTRKGIQCTRKGSPLCRQHRATPLFPIVNTCKMIDDVSATPQPSHHQILPIPAARYSCPGPQFEPASPTSFSTASFGSESSEGSWNGDWWQSKSGVMKGPFYDGTSQPLEQLTTRPLCTPASTLPVTPPTTPTAARSTALHQHIMPFAPKPNFPPTPDSVTQIPVNAGYYSLT